MKVNLSGVAIAAAILMAATSTVHAQAWPQRPVKIIVPFAAGGGIDSIARIVAKHLSERLGQQFFVENRGGANGAIALQALKQSAPDGYTIAVTSDSPLVINPALYPKLAYQPLQDFVPIAALTRFPAVLTVNPSFPVRSIAELIARAKASPGQINYASAGAGNASHLAVERLALATGVKFQHVPYKGTAPAILATISGEVQFTFVSLQNSFQNIQAGQLLAIGIGETERMAQLPNTPAVAETIPGFEFSSWAGVIAPARTPAPIVDRLSTEVAAVMKLAEVQKQVTDQLMSQMPLTRPQFEQLIKDSTDRYAALVKALDLKVD